MKKLAGISSSTLENMTADKHVSMDVLERICTALDCELADAVELVPEEKQSQKYN